MEEDREQPTEEQATVPQETEFSADSEVGSQTADKSTSSSLGKFKSAEALLKAYTALEAEFTKKCQKLKQYENEKQESEKSAEEQLRTFLSNNAEATPYAEELLSMAKEPVQGSPFEGEFAKLLLSRLKKGQSDAVVDKYVLSDDRLKNMVIENYLEKLKDNIAPVVIGETLGARVASEKPPSPASLKDAKALVEKMFS